VRKFSDGKYQRFWLILTGNRYTAEKVNYLRICSCMSDMPQMPPASSPAEFRRLLRQRIENLERELLALRALEAEYEAIEQNTPSLRFKDAFANMQPYDAIHAFLKSVGMPQTREAIIKGLIASGANFGQNKRKSINQSITTNVKLDKLKKVNDYIGLISWADRKFQS